MAVGNSINANNSLSLMRAPPSTDIPDLTAYTALWSFKRDPTASSAILSAIRTIFCSPLQNSDNGFSGTDVAVGNPSTLAYVGMVSPGPNWFWIAYVRPANTLGTTVYYKLDTDANWTTLGLYDVINVETYVDRITLFISVNSDFQANQDIANKHAIWNSQLTLAELLLETQKKLLQRSLNIYHYEPLDGSVSPGIDQSIAGHDYTAAGTGVTVINDSPAFAGDDLSVITFSPADNSTNVSINTDLSLLFIRPIFPDTGDIRLYNAITQELIQTININNSSLVNFNISTVTININDLVAYTEYDVQVDNTAIEDIFGNHWTNYNDGYTKWSFTTQIIDPNVIIFEPANNTSGANIYDNLSLTFNQNITAGTGNIYIYKNTETLVQTIASNDISHITIIGNIVTIVPLNYFEIATHYYVIIDPGAFVGVNNNWAGISHNNIWSFNTQPSQISFNNPLFGQGF